MVVALAVSVLFATLKVGDCLDNDSSGGAVVSSAGLTISYDADGWIVSDAYCVTIDAEVFNSTAVILKVEIEIIVEIGVTSFGGAGSVITWADAMTFFKLVDVLGSTVTVFVSSIVWVTVRIIGVVVVDNGGGELPSMATMEYEVRF